MKYNHLTEKEIVTKFWLEVPLLKDHPFCNEKVALKKGWPLVRGTI
jgi:hypothetical protein